MLRPLLSAPLDGPPHSCRGLPAAPGCARLALFPVTLLGQEQVSGAPMQILLQVLPFLLVGFFAWTLLYKPERERMKRQQDLLAGLKKNDRVLTSAGIYGTVANVDRDAGRVTLKVDDAANVKIQVALSTIATVLDGSAEAAASGV
ncbi:MAG: preprotein translocase subunit YajC [Planctomycetota bacterium]|nr:MAG: preprotein translocase subunit YajC [Planctomycetota bacterium]